MTLAEIMRLALRQLDEDPEDVSEYDDLFRLYANQGYRIAVHEYYKPREVRCLKSNDRGMICIAEQDIRRVVELRRVIRRAECWQRVYFDLSPMGENLFVPAWPDTEFMAVVEVDYPDMIEGTDVPKIPESAHGALVDYVCYRHLSNGNLAKQGRAQFYLNQFYDGMRRMRPQGMGSVTRETNLYAATDIRA